MYLLVSLLQLNALVVGNGSYILWPCGHDLHGPTGTPSSGLGPLPLEILDPLLVKMSTIDNVFLFSTNLTNFRGHSPCVAPLPGFESHGGLLPACHGFLRSTSNVAPAYDMAAKLPQLTVYILTYLHLQALVGFKLSIKFATAQCANHWSHSDKHWWILYDQISKVIRMNSACFTSWTVFELNKAMITENDTNSLNHEHFSGSHYPLLRFIQDFITMKFLGFKIYFWQNAQWVCTLNLKSNSTTPEGLKIILWIKLWFFIEILHDVNARFLNLCRWI